MSGEPLEKLVARRAGLSRRIAGQAIRRGRVEVDGTVLRDPRARVAPGALSLDGEPLPEPLSIALWHKPPGILCTLRDGLGRPTLASAVPALIGAGLRPVGRLDADTSGLLVFTRDGALTQRLLHPKRAVPRTYRARVEGDPGPALVDALAAGVATAEGVFTAERVRIEGTEVTLTVREGKHRMVRRMLANAGHPVQDLQRLAFGALTLGDLPPGAWREPTEAETTYLAQLAPEVPP